MADDTPANPGSSDTARLDALEAKTDSMSGTLSEVLRILKGTEDGGKQPEAPAPADRDIAAEIRQQLDERAAAEKSENDKKAGEDRIGALETRVSELAEKPPQPMPRRSTRLMWGRD